MPRELKTPFAKMFVFDILATTENIDDTTGTFERRTHFPKPVFRGYRTLRDKLVSNMEIAVVNPDQLIAKEKDADGKEVTIKRKLSDINIEEVEWISFKEMKIPEGKKMVRERHTNVVIEVSDNEAKTVKFFLNERDEIPDYPVEALDEVEELIKDLK